MPYGYGGGSGPGPGGQSSDRGGSLSGRGRDPDPRPGGDRHPPAQPVAHTVVPTAQYDDRIQRIAAQNQRTAALRNRASNQGFHQFLTPRTNYQRPTLRMRLSGLGGLLGGIGRGALGFFGGLPGKALSGIMTAKNWAKQKGAGVLDEVEEFSNYPTLDRYLNRNTGKYDDKPYRGHGQGYTFDDQVATNVTNPNLNLNTIDATDTNYIPQNIPLQEELLNTPTFAAEGGRIGYALGTPDPDEPTEDIFEFIKDQNIPIGEQVEAEITEEQKAMVLDMLDKEIDIETIMSITGVGQEDIMTLMGGTSMAPDQDYGLASLV